MRELNYPTDARVKLLDLYDNVWESFTLQKGKNLLPLTKREFKLQDDKGNTFRIYEGEGTLEFEDALETYDFTTLDLEALGHYIWTQEHKEGTTNSQKKLIEKFVKVYEKNMEKECEYLTPYGFKKLDEALVKM